MTDLGVGAPPFAVQGWGRFSLPHAAFALEEDGGEGREAQVERVRPGGPRLSCLFLDGTAERDDSSAVAEPRSGLRRGCPTLCCARVGKDFPASPTLQTAKGGPPNVSCGARGAPP